jgi:alcohol dehydrogenase YqhD (iron-dependent ADH family)
MLDYGLCIPTRIVYGCGRFREIGNFVKEYGHTVLLLNGGESILRAGVNSGVTDSLQKNGIQ